MRDHLNDPCVSSAERTGPRHLLLPHKNLLQLDRSWFRGSFAVATTITGPRTDRLLLEGLHEKCG
jgi:hypothetical protein